MKQYSFLIENIIIQEPKYPIYDKGVSQIKDIINGHDDVHLIEKAARGETYIMVYRGEPTKCKFGFTIYPDKAQSSASQFGLLGHRNGPISRDCTEDDVKCALKALGEWL